MTAFVLIPYHEIMDGEIVTLPSQNQKPSDQPSRDVSSQDNKKKTGIFVTVFVGIVAIFLFFVTLNYFNILPFPSLFLDQLGFLPHKTSQQSNNITIAPTASPSISLLEPAKQILNSYLPTILSSSVFPQSSSDINLKEDKGIKQSVSGTWDTKDGKAITIFTISPDGKEISELLLFFPHKTTASASMESAQLTTPKLFSIIPKGKWACKTIPNIGNYCENFWEEENGVRRGIALKQPLPLSQAKKITISFCERSQESRLYSWKSCTSEFAKTGIQ